MPKVRAGDHVLKQFSEADIAKNFEEAKIRLEAIREAEEQQNAHQVHLELIWLRSFIHQLEINQQRMEKKKVEETKTKEEDRKYSEDVKKEQDRVDKLDEKTDKELSQLRQAIEKDLETYVKIWTDLHSELNVLEERKSSLEEEKYTIQNEKKNIQDERTQLETEEKELHAQAAGKPEEQMKTRLSEIIVKKEELMEREKKLINRESDIVEELSNIGAQLISKMDKMLGIQKAITEFSAPLDAITERLGKGLDDVAQQFGFKP